MQVLAVIPARSGSKRLPGKNLRPCAVLPLIEWSIHAALDSRQVTRVAVSADAPMIAAMARAPLFHHRRGWSVEVILRPDELATDTATTDSVLVHAISEAPESDLVVLLQPTVPVRERGLVDACIRRLIDTGADSLLTAYPLHFVWWRESNDPERAADADPRWRSQCPRRPRRQDMEAREIMWHEDGSVYVCKAALLRSTGARLGGHIEVYETRRTVDIDTAEDLVLAEAMLLQREAVSA